NGAPDLPSTIDSILSQEAVNLELIVVDDGSTDESARILEEYCRSDPRVHIVTQENAGLTRALARGCAAARGKFVDRQDVGDISLPKRLFKQLSYIHANPDAALVSCGTRFIGPT